MINNMEFLVSTTTTIINKKYADSLPSIEQINEEATMVREKMFPVSDEEFEHAINELQRNIRHSIGEMISLKGEDADHKSWYFVHENDNYFWNRYKEYLFENNHWSREIVDRLDETTDRIMDDLGNPNDVNRPFQRRGLLLGDVQSGKTSTYTALCNKAVDSGYKVIIILAGMMENLRVQTQGRLDKEFIGISSKYAFDSDENHDIQITSIGVGKYGLVLEDKKIDRFTSVEKEFNINILRAGGQYLGKRPALFVVKKNKTVLNNLIDWLNRYNTNPTSGLIEYPLLLIDDEADNASVNTNSAEKDPAAINSAIRKILNSFKQASYVGITATPFANIFIDPDPEDDEARDLFPKDFLTVLPTPERYIGADRIFGNGNADNWESIDDDRIPGEFENAIIPIKNIEQENFFYYKHKKEIAEDLFYLPDSLCEAILYFVLVTGITDVRLDTNKHRSMLVNVSRFTKVQNAVTDLIENYVNAIKRDIANYSQIGEDALKIEKIAQLKEIWDKYKLEAKAKISWDIFMKSYLNKAARRVLVRSVNQSTGASSLDYSEFENTGMRVIAVGGNSLSRGLTLEGLCVSYFYRNTMMYDTLLQMGRWFGYRPNYEDLFKIWMGEDSIEWYGYVTDAINELKDELKVMERQNLSPDDFGLKVRKAPGSLMVTARNKMRTGTLVSTPITVAGRMIETPRLLCDQRTIDANERLCKQFMKELVADDNICNVEYDKFTKAFIWRNVPKEKIISLVKEFKTHPWNLNFQPVALADYIQEDDHDLDLWDVAIPQGRKGDTIKLVLSDDITIEPILEQRQLERDLMTKNLIKVNGHHVRVGTGGCSKIGLSENEIKALRKKTKKTVTDKTYLETDRNPIALIHILQNSTPEKERKKNDPNILYALGLGFPCKAGGETKQARYVVNVRELSNWIDANDLEEDDEDENIN